MSDQKIKFVGTNGRYGGDQKELGVKLLYDDEALEEPNLDFAILTKQLTDSWFGKVMESKVSLIFSKI